jgi:DNA replication protein DnaC
MHTSISTQLEAIAFLNIQQLTEGFTGRSHILNDIDHWLQQKDQRFFILTGESGVGKSAIAFAGNYLTLREPLITIFNRYLMMRKKRENQQLNS